MGEEGRGKREEKREKREEKEEEGRKGTSKAHRMCNIKNNYSMIVGAAATCHLTLV